MTIITGVAQQWNFCLLTQNMFRDTFQKPYENYPILYVLELNILFSARLLFKLPSSIAEKAVCFPSWPPTVIQMTVHFHATVQLTDHPLSSLRSVPFRPTRVYHFNHLLKKYSDFSNFQFVNAISVNNMVD